MLAIHVHTYITEEKILSWGEGMGEVGEGTEL